MQLLPEYGGRGGPYPIGHQEHSIAWCAPERKPRVAKNCAARSIQLWTGPHFLLVASGRAGIVMLCRIVRQGWPGGYMPPTLGLIVAIFVISWLLGWGDIKKGLVRFWGGQWLLLGVVLGLLAAIFVFGGEMRQ